MAPRCGINSDDADADAGQRRECQKDQPLNPRQRRRAQNLAQHQAGARRGRNQHRQQKSFAAVFDDRDGGEDRGEHHRQHQRAGVEARQVVRAIADQQPEHQRRRHHAQHAALLAPETHQFALPQGRRRQRKLFNRCSRFAHEDIFQRRLVQADRFHRAGKGLHHFGDEAMAVGDLDAHLPIADYGSPAEALLDAGGQRRRCRRFPAPPRRRRCASADPADVPCATILP